MFRPGPPRDLLELSGRFALLDIEVDVDAARAVREGTQLPLEPKAFDLLLLFAANPERLIEKREIFERLWPNALVTDNALTRVVAHLRRELGDDAEAPRFVETVRTRGYRFLVAPAAVPDSHPSKGGRDASAADGAGSVARWRRGGRVTLAILAVVAATWAWLGRPRSAAEREWTPIPRQVTLERGYRGDADFSPDASQIVYSSDAAGGLQLFVRPFGGGPEVQLTHGGGPKVEAAWSPDGQSIVYRDVADGGLWSISPTGGPPLKLVEAGAQPAWFPDSRRLVFSRPGPVTPGFGGGWPATYGSTLWVLDLASGSTHELTTVDVEAGGHGQPAVSADGRWVYFATSRHFGGGALWRVPARGGAPETLTPTEPLGEEEYWNDPTPAPDGRALLAMANRGGARVVRIELGRNGGAPRAIYPGAPDGVAQLALSRDGRHLLYAIVRGRSTLEEVEIDPRTLSVLAERTLASPGTRRVLRPKYSPDGARVAYLRRRTGAPTEEVVIERSTGEERAFTSESASTSEQLAYSKAWTGPESLLIRFLGQEIEFDVVSGRRRSRAVSPGLASLLERARPRPSAMSADGRAFAFTAAGDMGAQELFLGDPATGDAVQRTRFGRRVNYPSFSRDGRWIGFQVVAEAGTGNEIWRLGRTSDEPVRLATGDGPSWACSFSPDGETAVYAARRSTAWHLGVAGPEHPERLLEVTPETTGYLRWPDWSPDGRHIVYERMRYEASLWTIELADAR